MLADGPDLDPRAVDRVVESWRGDGGDVVAASYGGVRLHPVLLARTVWPQSPGRGRAGARGPARRRATTCALQATSTSADE